MQAATVVINRRALRHNLQRLRELAPASKLVAVVKANAYGHGLIETARTLPDADAFGVARLEEALRLRAGGITQPVLLLEGFFEASDLTTIADQHLHTAVHNEEQLAALETAELSEPVTVWMKLDTGMHRLGVRPEKADAFYQRLCQCKTCVSRSISSVTLPVPMSQNVAPRSNSSISLTPSAKANRECALLPPPAIFCSGRSPTLTGRVLASFSMAFRRWTASPGGRILASSR